jgi:5'-3' exonuclease, N-terminal resolvase-like domain
VKLLLVDAASLYFRAFYGVKQPLPAPDGTPTNAVRGFLDMVSTVITRFRPTDVAACIDEDCDPRLARLAPRLNAARDYLVRAALVVRTARTLELPAVATALPPTPPDTARLAELAARWGIGGSLARAASAVGLAATG